MICTVTDTPGNCAAASAMHTQQLRQRHTAEADEGIAAHDLLFLSPAEQRSKQLNRLFWS